mgnify:CR=1 FL=1
MLLLRKNFAPGGVRGLVEYGRVWAPAPTFPAQAHTRSPPLEVRRGRRPRAASLALRGHSPSAYIAPPLPNGPVLWYPRKKGGGGHGALAGGGGRLCPAGGASAGGVRTGGSPGDGAGGGRQALLSGGAGAALQCEPQRNYCSTI